jgi:UDP-3-O-[3-hydroxymyristoyl] glucosamine N-acyltransferase
MHGYRLDELAAHLGGRFRGEGALRLLAVRPLEDAGPTDLSLLTSPRYRAQALASQAGALLGAPSLAEDPGFAARDLLLADDPALALASLLALFVPARGARPGTHATAIVDPTASVDPTAAIGAYAVVGAGSVIAADAVVHPHVVVGEGCRIGPASVLHPHAVLYDDTELGARCIVHAGVVLGGDGFGYATSRGVHHKVPQIGRVVIEDDVEIGANTTIDRATLGETRIGAGTKIDNLVQVGHNVKVGKASVLCGQAGIAGSARLGDGVVLAGQSGVSGHIDVGSGVQVAAKSALLQSAEAGSKVAGIPAIELSAWRRQASVLARLPELARRVRALEKKLEKEPEPWQSEERQPEERKPGEEE